MLTSRTISATPIATPASSISPSGTFWRAIWNVTFLVLGLLSGGQEALIVAAVGPKGKVALMFDEDEAGWKGREDALSRLAHRVFVKVIGLGDERDPAR
jgi:hypothetical protein